jgi:hypothetical protein
MRLQRSIDRPNVRPDPAAKAVLLTRLLVEANGVAASLYQLARHAHSAKLPYAEQLDASLADNHRMVEAVLEELMLCLTEGWRGHAH